MADFSQFSVTRFIVLFMLINLGYQGFLMYNQNKEKNQTETAKHQDDKEGENIGFRIPKDK